MRSTNAQISLLIYSLSRVFSVQLYTFLGIPRLYKRPSKGLDQTAPEDCADEHGDLAMPIKASFNMTQFKTGLQRYSSPAFNINSVELLQRCRLMYFS